MRALFQAAPIASRRRAKKPTNSTRIGVCRRPVSAVLGKLQEIFQGLVAREEAPHSPILETMDDLVQRHEDLDSIVLVSDMLQHTHLWSHYNGEGDMSGISPTCDRVGMQVG